MRQPDVSTPDNLVLTDIDLVDAPLDLTDEFLVQTGRDCAFIPEGERPGLNESYRRILPPAYVPLRVAVVAELAKEVDPYSRARIFLDFLDGLEAAIRLRPRSTEAQDVASVIASIRDHLAGVSGSDALLHHGAQAISCALLTALSLRGLDEAVASRAIVSQIESLGFPPPDGDPDSPSWMRLLAWRELLQDGRLNVYLRTIYKSAMALALQAPRPKDRVSFPIHSA
jgi:hypothetical protein